MTVLQEGDIEVCVNLRLFYYLHTQQNETMNLLLVGVDWSLFGLDEI